jgi:hypothetical protein
LNEELSIFLGSKLKNKAPDKIAGALILIIWLPTIIGVNVMKIKNPLGLNGGYPYAHEYLATGLTCHR